MGTERDTLILHADDNAPGRYVVTRMLQRGGYEVIEAATGAEALQLASARSPDLVVLDVHLPDIDGFEVARRLKADPATSTIPVLHLSATAVDSASVSAGLESGGDAYLVEPVDTRVLLSTVHALLRTRRAEEARRESEERYRSLFQSMQEGMLLGEVILSTAGEAMDFRCLEVNPAFERLTGLSREQVLGRRASEVLPTLDRYWLERYARVALTGIPDRLDRFVPELGRHYEAVAFSPQRGHFASFFADVTSQKRAEVELRKREAVLAQAGQMAHLGAWDIELRDPDDVNANPLVWSDEVYRIFGYEPGAVAVTNDLFFAHVPPQERQQIAEAVARAIATRQRYQIEHHIIRADGAERIVQEHAEVVFDNGGRPLRIVGAVQDITDRRRAEQEREALLEQVQDQRALLETVIGNIRSGVAYFSPDFVYRMGNRQYAEFLQAPPEALLGRSYLDLVPSPEAEATFRRVVETKEPAERREMPYVFPGHPERGVTYWDWRLAPLLDAEGEVEGLVASAIDVTEEVRTRQQLLEAERARADIAERMTLEINHRMKNNLTVLSGVLEMQAMRQPAGSLPVLALRDAITRLTALSVVHEQLYEAKSGRVGLASVLERVAALDVQTLAVADVAIKVTGAETFVSSKLGSTLALAANELITNALKYGAPGGSGKLEIEVALSYLSDGLHLRVWNSGNPVPGDFEASAQTGVGLTLVNDVVAHQLEGSLALRPDRGGTVAEVFVPESAVRAAEFVPIGEGRATPSV